MTDNILTLCRQHLPRIDWEVTGLWSVGAVLGNLKTAMRNGNPLYVMMEYAHGNTGYRASLVELVDNKAVFFVFADPLRKVALTVTEAFTDLRLLTLGVSQAHATIEGVLGLSVPDQSALTSMIDRLSVALWADKGKEPVLKWLEAVQLVSNEHNRELVFQAMYDLTWLERQRFDSEKDGDGPSAKDIQFFKIKEEAGAAYQAGEFLKVLKMHKDSRPNFSNGEEINGAPAALYHRWGMLNDMANAYEGLGCPTIAAHIQHFMQNSREPEPWGG